MRESEIERKLKEHVESRKGKCWKWVSPGTNGVPDRICFLPGGKIIFVELKKPGEVPDPLQVYRHQQLRNLGFEVLVIDSLDFREVTNAIRAPQIPRIRDQANI